NRQSAPNAVVLVFEQFAWNLDYKRLLFAQGNLVVGTDRRAAGKAQQQAATEMQGYATSKSCHRLNLSELRDSRRPGAGGIGCTLYPTADCRTDRSTAAALFSRLSELHRNKKRFFNLQQVGSGGDCLHSAIFSHPSQAFHQLAAG